MTKKEFLDKLRDKLKGLKNEDVLERLDFYSEMIDDRMEEGLSEKEAVFGVGSVDEIAVQIREEYSKGKKKKGRCDKLRKMKAWEIVLLAVGSPIWVSLLVVAFAVAIVLAASVWSVVASAWSIFGAFIGVALGGSLGAIFTVIFGDAFAGILLLGGSIACAGLAIFAFFGCRELTKAIVRLTKWAFVSVFVRRRGEYEKIN